MGVGVGIPVTVEVLVESVLLPSHPENPRQTEVLEDELKVMAGVYHWARTEAIVGSESGEVHQLGLT